MNELMKRDGFCRAPRIEMVSGGSQFQTMTFDEMLSAATYTYDDDASLASIKNLANTKE